MLSTDAKLFDTTIKTKIIEGISQGGEDARIWVAVVANLARGQSVGQIGSLIGEGDIVQMILAQCQNEEDTEAVEGALSVCDLIRADALTSLTQVQALEVLVLRCPTEVSFEISAIVQRSLELVKYDPVRRVHFLLMPR